jgi:site-specific recombinase XerD
MSRAIITPADRRFSILPPEWKIVFEANQSTSTNYRQAQVAQFIYFANFEHASPNRIERAIFENFRIRKIELLGSKNGHKSVQIVFRAWEILRTRVDLALSSVPADLLVARFVNPPLSIYPKSFQDDLHAYCMWLRHRSVHWHSDEAIATGDGERQIRLPLREISIKNSADLIKASAGAQIRSGRGAKEIGAIRDVVSASAIGTMLIDRRSRRRAPRAPSSDQVARWAYTDALTARRLAWIAMAWCKITLAEQNQIDEFLMSVPWKKRYDRFFRPVNVVRRLRQFDDPATFERWMSLPDQLVRRAEKALRTAGKVQRQAINDVEVALSLALLRESPIRLRTLAALRLRGPQPNIVAGKETLLIVYPDDSKSRRDMRIPLSSNFRRILDLYISQYRSGAVHFVHSSHDNVFLFPGIAAKNRHPVSISANWKRHHAEIGLDVNIHLVRHIMAKIAASHYKATPESIRLLLGHKSLDTTFRCYFEDAVPKASQHLQGLLSSSPRVKSPIATRAISPYVEIASVQLPTSEQFKLRPRFQGTTADYRREVLRSFVSFRAYLQDHSCPPEEGEFFIRGFIEAVGSECESSTIVNVLRQIVRAVVELCTRDTASSFIRDVKPLIQKYRRRSSSERPFCTPTTTVAANHYIEDWPAPIGKAWGRAVSEHRVVGQRRLDRELERQLAHIYARFLSFSRSKGMSTRLCRASVIAFLDDARARGLKPSSLWRYADDLLRFAKIVETSAELTWFSHLVRECRQVHRQAQGFRGIEIITQPEDLLSLGRELIERSEHQSLTHVESAVIYRDGLLIQFLISVPLRLEMLYRIGIDDVRLHSHDASIFISQTTLVGIRRIEFPLWPDVRRLMARYVDVYRPMLATDQSENALWISRRGRRLSRSGIDHALTSRTMEKFGISIPPDRIRQIVANWIIEQTPADFPHAATLLQLHGIDSFRQYAERAGMILARNLVTAKTKTGVHLRV